MLRAFKMCVLLAGVLSVAMFAGVAQGEQPSVVAQEQAQQQADHIAGTIMSPFCPGRLLRDCPSSLATQLKGDIRARIEKGESPQQIVDSLVALYGTAIFAAPQFSQFGIVGWVAPFAFLLVGLGGLLYWLRTLRVQRVVDQSASGEEAEDHAQEAHLDPDLQRRVDRALHSD